MARARNNWTRDELILALDLYYRTPFSKIGAAHVPSQECAHIIGRSVNAVALKLANYARLDPALQNRGIAGMKNGSKGEEEVWNEFHNNWSELSWHSAEILAKLKNDNVENVIDLVPLKLPSEGKEREATVKVRVNQAFFRKVILASYNNKCCITGTSHAPLLVASHIMPWALDVPNRMNPHNGLCLNVLHDKAFELGWITITPDYQILISERLKEDAEFYKNFFYPYEKRKIILPDKFPPDRQFLEQHNSSRFLG